MSSKRERPLEIAQQQLIDMSAIVREACGKRWWPKDIPSNMPGGYLPGSWPTRRLKRLLNLAVEKRYDHAYTLLVRFFLMKHGVRVPPRVFSKNLGGQGTGRQPSKAKRDFGEKALRRQTQLIFGSDPTPIDPRDPAGVCKRLQLVSETNPSFKASQIAAEMKPIQYRRDGKARAAVVKYVTESISATKDRRPIEDTSLSAILTSLGLFPSLTRSVRKNLHRTPFAFYTSPYLFYFPDVNGPLRTFYALRLSRTMLKRIESEPSPLIFSCFPLQSALDAVDLS